MERTFAVILINATKGQHRYVVIENPVEVNSSLRRPSSFGFLIIYLILTLSHSSSKFIVKEIT